MPDPQLGAIPGHVGVTPFEPSEPRIVGAEARRGVEIVAEDQRAERTRAVDRDVDQCIDRLVGAGLVVLADPDHAAPRRIHSAVRITQPSWLRWSFGDRDRLSCALLSVQPLVGIIAEINNTAADQIRAATIFMDPAADVEPR